MYDNGIPDMDGDGNVDFADECLYYGADPADAPSDFDAPFRYKPKSSSLKDAWQDDPVMLIVGILMALGATFACILFS